MEILGVIGNNTLRKKLQGKFIVLDGSEGCGKD